MRVVKSPTHGSKLAAARGAIAVSVLSMVLAACGARGPALQPPAAAATPAPSPSETMGTAHVGDGVCAQSMNQDGDTVASASPGTAPRHTRDQAIEASYSRLTPPFRSGTFDAYFATFNGRATWVVEVSNVTYPDPGGITSTKPFDIHHVVQMLEDDTLATDLSFLCP